MTSRARGVDETCEREKVICGAIHKTNDNIISRILYAAPAFCKLLSVAQVDRINGFLRKVYCFGLIDKQYE